MVKFILAEDTLQLRSAVLRNGQSPEQCSLPGDDAAEAFHLGFFLGKSLVSVASFLPEPLPHSDGKGFRLRGMATAHGEHGKGYGSALLGFAVDCLKGFDVDYVWCNARSTAASFYKRNGFQVLSPEFDIPGIGFHYEMKLNLK